MHRMMLLALVGCYDISDDDDDASYDDCGPDVVDGPALDAAMADCGYDVSYDVDDDNCTGADAFYEEAAYCLLRDDCYRMHVCLQATFGMYCYG